MVSCQRIRLLAPVLFVMLAWLAPEARAEDGKQLFLKYECHECHAIQAENVAVQEPAEEEPEIDGDALDVGFGDDFDGAEEDEAEPPDLSGVGKRHEAAWMQKFVTKKIANDEGKKHRKRFKGTDEELTALVAYLATLKKDAPPDDAD